MTTKNAVTIQIRPPPTHMPPPHPFRPTPPSANRPRALAPRPGVSGKCLGEVERWEKSISGGSPSGVSRALKASARPRRAARLDPAPVPSEDAEKLLALLVQPRAPRGLHQVYRVLR